MTGSDTPSSDDGEPELVKRLRNAISTIFAPVVSLTSTLTSRSAQKAYLTSVVFILASLILIGISTIAYVLFYYQYIPQIGLERTVHLQFDEAHNPYALISLSTSPSTTPLVANQAYDVTIILHLPRTPSNLALGNFMLDAELLSPPSSRPVAGSHQILSVLSSNTSTTIARSRRPAILTYTSPPLGHFKTLLRLPWYILGILPLHRLESEVLEVSMFEQAVFQRGWRNIPSLAKIELVPPSLPLENGCARGSKMQIYDVKILFRARFTGLRWVMYNHRIFSFMTFTSAFYIVSVLSMSIAWVAFSILLSGSGEEGSKAAEIKSGEHQDQDVMYKQEGEEARRIKIEDDDGPSDSPLSVSNLSDNPTMFPTLGRQMPLQYPIAHAEHPGSASETYRAEMQQKEGDGVLSPAMRAQGQGDAEGDAEDEGNDNVGDASFSAFRDSGLGTSLEEREGASGLNTRAAGTLQRRRSSRQLEGS